MYPATILHLPEQSYKTESDCLSVPWSGTPAPGWAWEEFARILREKQAGLLPLGLLHPLLLVKSALAWKGQSKNQGENPVKLLEQSKK